MDKSKVQYLLNVSKQYLNDELETDAKEAVVNISQDLFYQTLFNNSMDSEFKKRVQLFAVMTHRLGQGKTMCHQKTEDLQEMVEFIQNSGL